MRTGLVRDGETVVDMLAKLSAQVRVFAVGNGRKTDPVDARSVALLTSLLKLGRRTAAAIAGFTVLNDVTARD